MIKYLEHKRKHTDRHVVIVMQRHTPPAVDPDWTLESVYDSFFYETEDGALKGAHFPVTVWVFDKNPS
jgi:hypothetical protein